MTGPQVLTALKAKRAELAGEVLTAERALAAARARLEAVDATIVVFDPDAEPERIPAKLRRRRVAWAGRGGMCRPVLEALRAADGPLTTREVALAVARRWGPEAADPKAMTEVTERVAQALRRQRYAGAARSEPGPGRCSLWTLA